MSDVYEITNWADTFEKSQSKRAKKHHWVAMPVKHDGAGFRRITIQDDATDLFAAWCLIVQVGAKCATRGVLSNEDGVGLDSEDLAIKTGFPIAIFDRALEFFSNPKIGWLTRSKTQNTPSETKDSERAPSKTQKTPSESQNTPTKKAHSTIQYNTDTTTQTEGCGRHPEFRYIIACSKLDEISIESYLRIKQSFPKVRHEEVVKMATLKADDPKCEIKNQYRWLVSQFQYAEEVPAKFDCSDLIVEICD